MAHLDTDVAPMDRPIARADNLDKGVDGFSDDSKASALKLAQVAEECDDEMWMIQKTTSSVTGEDEIRVWMTYAPSEPKPMPEPLHELLTEWGYEPAPHNGPGNEGSQHAYFR